MELLEHLNRRQLETLTAVRKGQSEQKGASLNFVARTLRIRPPSALGRLTTLERLNLVARYRGKSRLTPRGESCLSEYRRHHRVAESLFQRVGLSLEATHAAALEVDLALSHRTIDRLCEAEGHPKECPHGEPIDPCVSGSRSGARA
jgi:DtxR family transcriptional regulator, Mn-dependent transcriptional regulator